MLLLQQLLAFKSVLVGSGDCINYLLDRPMNSKISMDVVVNYESQQGCKFSKNAIFKHAIEPNLKIQLNAQIDSQNSFGLFVQIKQNLKLLNSNVVIQQLKTADLISMLSHYQVQEKLELYNSRLAVQQNKAVSLNQFYLVSKSATNFIINQTEVQIEFSQINEFGGLSQVITQAIVNNTNLVYNVESQVFYGISKQIDDIIVSHSKLSGLVHSKEIFGVAQLVQVNINMKDIQFQITLLGDTVHGFISTLSDDAQASFESINFDSVIDDNGAIVSTIFITSTNSKKVSITSITGYVGGTWKYISKNQVKNLEISIVKVHEIIIQSQNSAMFVFNSQQNMNNTEIEIDSQEIGLHNVQQKFGFFSDRQLFYNVTLKCDRLSANVAQYVQISLLSTTISSQTKIISCKVNMRVSCPAYQCSVVGLTQIQQAPVEISNLIMNSTIDVNGAPSLLLGWSSAPVLITNATVDSWVTGVLKFGALLINSQSELVIKNSNIKVAVSGELTLTAAFVGTTGAGFSFSISGSKTDFRGLYQICGCVEGACEQIKANLCERKTYTVSQLHASKDVKMNGSTFKTQCAFEDSYNWNQTIIQAKVVQQLTGQAAASIFCYFPVFYNVQIDGDFQVSSDKKSLGAILMSSAYGKALIKNVIINANITGSPLMDLSGFLASSEAQTDIINCSYSGHVFAQQIASAFIATIYSGVVSIQNCSSTGYISTKDSVGHFFGVVARNAVVSSDNSSIYGCVSAPGISTAGAIGGQNSGSFTGNANVAVSGSFKACPCGRGDCIGTCATYQKEINVIVASQKSVISVNGADIEYSYGLGGVWDWNSSNVVLSLTPSTNFGTFADYPIYNNIYITGTVTFLSQKYYGGLFVGNVYDKENKPVIMIDSVKIDVKLFGKAIIGGLVTFVIQDINMNSVSVSGSLRGKQVGMIAFQVSAPITITKSKTENTSHASADEQCGILTNIYSAVTITSLTSKGKMDGTLQVACFTVLFEGSSLSLTESVISISVTGTSYTSALVALQNAGSSSIFQNLTVSSKINAQFSLDAGSLVAQAKTGANILFVNVTSSCTGQFVTCPMNLNSEYAVTEGVTCVTKQLDFTDTMFTEAITPAIDGVNSNMKTYYKFETKKTDYNHTRISVNNDHDAFFFYGDADKYYSEFNPETPWFEDVEITGHRTIGSQTVRGGSFVAYTQGVTIIKCKSDIQYDGKGLAYDSSYDYADFIGFNLGPSKIISSIASTYFSPLQCQSVRAGYVYENKNHVDIINSTFDASSKTDMWPCTIWNMPVELYAYFYSQSGTCISIGNVETKDTSDYKNGTPCTNQ
ncbi:Hypothetical_protein [Hexamita inflata]|uniref:Hypothetical_protein n=1 Tax=Hexamita inflata TaxID=28002 RepID=A0AA86UXR8_9EUKA|nr:Hypothetical protein HINF_LOCUS59894 [Hexamita inflata]